MHASSHSSLSLMMDYEESQIPMDMVLLLLNSTWSIIILFLILKKIPTHCWKSFKQDNQFYTMESSYGPNHLVWRQTCLSASKARAERPAPPTPTKCTAPGELELLSSAEFAALNSRHFNSFLRFPLFPTLTHKCLEEIVTPPTAQKDANLSLRQRSTEIMRELGAWHRRPSKDFLQANNS